MPVKTFYLRAKTCLTLLLAALCSLPSFADVTLDQLDFYRNETGYSVRKKEGATLEGALTIPEIYNGLPVTEIGYNAFYGCEQITEIHIPKSVTKIGESVFLGVILSPKSILPIQSRPSVGGHLMGVVLSPKSIVRILSLLSANELLALAALSL